MHTCSLPLPWLVRAERDATCSKTEIRYKIGRCQTYFFSKRKPHYTRQKVRISCNKTRRFYRDEYVCPFLAKPEVINCDGSCMFWGSESSAHALRGKKKKANWGIDQKVLRAKGLRDTFTRCFFFSPWSCCNSVLQKETSSHPCVLQLWEPMGCRHRPTTSMSLKPVVCWACDY